jgi:hypothetical protein
MTFIAFNHYGYAHNLGDCGDYFSAVKIADDALGDDNWQFILSASELEYIVKAAGDED